jgi:hypothetical protein
VSEHQLGDQSFHVRRVPVNTIVVSGEAGDSSVDPATGEVVVADAVGTDADAGRDALVDKAFAAGLQAGAAATLRAVAALAASAARRASRARVLQRGTPAVLPVRQSVSGCFQATLVYPTELDPQWVRPQPPRQN